jgi:hypothetical protein
VREGSSPKGLRPFLMPLFTGVRGSMEFSEVSEVHGDRRSRPTLTAQRVFICTVAHFCAETFVRHNHPTSPSVLR